MGVVTFILLLGYMPFSGAEACQIRQIEMGKYTQKPDKWDKLSESAKSFIKGLLVVSEKERMTAQVALAHEFVAKREDKRLSQIDNGMVEDLISFGHASGFRRACMSVMAWSLTSEDRKKVR